jgi:hypothetical protein
MHCALWRQLLAVHAYIPLRTAAVRVRRVCRATAVVLFMSNKSCQVVAVLMQTQHSGSGIQSQHSGSELSGCAAGQPSMLPLLLESQRQRAAPTYGSGCCRA